MIGHVGWTATKCHNTSDMLVMSTPSAVMARGQITSSATAMFIACVRAGDDPGDKPPCARTHEWQQQQQGMRARTHHALS